MLCLCSEEEEGFSRFFFFSSICWLRMEWKRERRSGDAQNEFIYYISLPTLCYHCWIKIKLIHSDEFNDSHFNAHLCIIYCLFAFSLNVLLHSPFPYLFFRGREKTGAKRDVKAIEFRKPQFFVMISARKWKKNRARASCEGWPL